MHHPHGRHGGGLPQWLELMIAGTALVTSICSIVIAIHHGHIMEKLVQASSIPYLIGVGPAHERNLRVKVDGQYAGPSMS